ncbi:hypothetical protein VTN00DRAFT_1404 [Thermoascus crustaceus]|uniref:uncharacterized protein n=1 Tax=Thermoascus crustaceus TaxID=5088 RepID=UPI00374356C2
MECKGAARTGLALGAPQPTRLSGLSGLWTLPRSRLSSPTSTSVLILTTLGWETPLKDFLHTVDPHVRFVPLNPPAAQPPSSTTFFHPQSLSFRTNPHRPPVASISKSYGGRRIISSPSCSSAPSILFPFHHHPDPPSAHPSVSAPSSSLPAAPIALPKEGLV